MDDFPNAQVLDKIAFAYPRYNSLGALATLMGLHVNTFRIWGSYYVADVNTNPITWQIDGIIFLKVTNGKESYFTNFYPGAFGVDAIWDCNLWVLDI